MEDHSDKIVKSCEVINKNLLSIENHKLGTIEEIVLDKLSGQARYIVLSCGGLLGVGDKLYALPWKSISYDEVEKSFKLCVNKDKLQYAPNFNKDNWPDFANSDFQKTIGEFYA